MTEKFGCLAARPGRARALRQPRRVETANHTRAARACAATRNASTVAAVLRWFAKPKKVSAG